MWVTVTGYRTNRPMQLRPFSDVLCVPIWILVIPDSSTRALCLQQRHLVAKQEVGEKYYPWIYPTEYLYHSLQGSLICHKILRHAADSFTFPLQKGVLRIFIAIENLSPSAWFEPANLRSSGKHDNHYTTKDDCVSYEFRFREIFKSLNKYFFYCSYFLVHLVGCRSRNTRLHVYSLTASDCPHRPWEPFLLFSRSQAPDRTLQEAMLGVNLKV
jgi:hypothetical protein